MVTRRWFFTSLAAWLAGFFLPLCVRNAHAGKTKADEKNKFGSTGFVFQEDFLNHVIHRGHPESPKRLIAIQRMMQNSGLIQKVVSVTPLANPLSHIQSVHTKAHIKKIASIETTGQVAALAVAGALGAVQAVAEKKIRNAFCALRPPGHHANNLGREEGFCFYNNVAVAARYAQKVCGFKKVLIIDWDYHHGNGTENAFYEDPSVLFFSTHNWRDYPGTGNPARRGKDKGLGYNINVHLRCRSGDDDMIKAWEEKLLPAVKDFKPDIVLISAGFDSRKDDLLGCFRVSDAGFVVLTQMAMSIADTYCRGRLVSLLEGGYNINGLAEAVRAHIETLMS